MTAEDTGGVMDAYGIDVVQDLKDRMTSWTRDTTASPLDSQTWSLSDESDWTSTTTVDGGVSSLQPRTHNAAHEILTFDPDGAGVVPTLTVTYDAKGNVTGDSFGAVNGTYDFDNHAKQGSVSLLSPVGIAGNHSYTYDALGRRVSKTVNPLFSAAKTTVFVHAGQQVIAEYTAGNAASNPDRKYVYCATGYIDEPLALIDATGASEATYYYHRNRQFTIIGLTDSTGAVVERYAYTAYGERTILAPDGVTTRSSSLVGNAFAYTGRRIDPESGFYYFRARMYDPVQGRFLQRDPLGYPDGMNGYAAYHVLWGTVDPTGMFGGGGWDPLGHRDRPMSEATRRRHREATERQIRAVKQYADDFVDGAKGAVEYVAGTGNHGSLHETVTSGNYGNDFAEGYDEVSGKIHTSLDAAGMCPGLGEPADALNGVLHTLEGNWVDAGLSFAAMVPFLGNAITPLKYADEAVDAAKALDNARDASKVADNCPIDTGPLYRRGTFPDPDKNWDGNYVKGKDWSQENPLTTPDYADSYGLPSGNSSDMPDWVAGGHVNPDAGAASFGAAPGIGDNVGGAFETTASPSDVTLDWFHMPD